MGHHSADSNPSAVARRSQHIPDGHTSLLGETLPNELDRVPDRDNIVRIHGVHSRTMKHHYDLYRELMYGRGPLTRAQREMIAVVVSVANSCHY